MVETEVHYPTDINLLFDAMRKVITLVAGECARHGMSTWRQSKYHLRQVKRLYRQAQKLKRSRTKDSRKQQVQQQRIRAAHQAYLDRARALLDRAEGTLAVLKAPALKLLTIKGFMEHAHRQIDQIRRRVLQGQTIAHAEKVFSLFEPHTEWISKGKAGVPVELGLRVCVLEDQYGFLLHHQVMQHQSDNEVAVSMVVETQQRFPGLRACSFDQGFYSPANQFALAGILDEVVLPKQGRLSRAERAVASSASFVAARRAHAGVESAINALEVHGLDRCPDHGLAGFKRYVALAVVARNIQQLGALIGAARKRRRARGKQAA